MQITLDSNNYAYIYLVIHILTLMEEAPIEKEKTPSAHQSSHAHPQKKKEETKIYKIIYYILGIIEVLLGLRFLLLFFGANLSAGLSTLIANLTAPLMAPFVGLFPAHQGDVVTFSTSTLVAMLVYALLFHGVVKLIKIIRGDE